jgi:hypothetical protein
MLTTKDIWSNFFFFVKLYFTLNFKIFLTLGHKMIDVEIVNI